MDIETWILMPTEKCYIEASCTISDRAGMYNCEGCIGDGKRVVANKSKTVKVTVDANDNVHIL